MDHNSATARSGAVSRKFLTANSCRVLQWISFANAVCHSQWSASAVMARQRSAIGLIQRRRSPPRVRRNLTWCWGGARTRSSRSKASCIRGASASFVRSRSRERIQTMCIDTTVVGSLRVMESLIFLTTPTSRTGPSWCRSQETRHTRFTRASSKGSST